MWDGTISLHPVAGINVVYTEVPKAGCTSVKLALAPFRGGPPEGDHDALHRWFGYSHARHIGEMQAWFATCWSDFLRFTVVRHPLARFESFYYEKLTDAERAVYGSIDRYVRETFPTDSWRWDVHTVPQTAMIGTELSVFHHVVKLEEIHKLGPILSKRARRKVVIPHANRSVAPRQPMTEATEAELREIYRVDFEVLGYD
jgi:hypothetical protein